MLEVLISTKPLTTLPLTKKGFERKMLHMKKMLLVPSSIMILLWGRTV